MNNCTLRFRPLNMLSLSTRAWATRFGSVNSTYAYLHHPISLPLLPGSETVVKRVSCERQVRSLPSRRDQPFWMSSELVQKYGNAIDGATALEVRLNFFGRSSIVDVTHKDASRIDVLLVLTQIVGCLIKRSLHFAQFSCLSLHLSDPSLHCRYFFLYHAPSAPTLHCCGRPPGAWERDKEPSSYFIIPTFLTILQVIILMFDATVRHGGRCLAGLVCRIEGRSRPQTVP